MEEVTQVCLNFIINLFSVGLGLCSYVEFLGRCLRTGTIRIAQLM